jgi:hypothetical protein
VSAHAHPPVGERAHDKPSLEVADIVRLHGEDFVRAHALSPDQHAVLRAIARCRTAALGGHVDVCDACGLATVAYNSCRNRHCPKCQALSQARWIESRMARVLPTHAFHVVFTLPSELQGLVMANREELFALLFASAADALLELGHDPRWLGGELAITTVLHTWTRDLRFHPHVHCVVSGGALSPDGTRWISTRRGFLLPVRVLGALFRGKFLARLAVLYERAALRLDGPAAPLADPARFTRVCDKLYRTRWVVYSKAPFGGPKQVFRYLGRYTHRVGISNRRLVSLDDRGVTFRTHGDQTVTLPPAEFLRRFLLHVLPKGFVKIRHHGLMSASHVPTRLALAHRLLEREPPAESPDQPSAASPDFRDLLLALTGIDLRRCPNCKAVAMHRYPLPTAHRATPPPDTS